METRKTFIKKSLTIGAMCCTGIMTGVLASCSSIRYVAFKENNGVISIPLSAFVKNDKVLIDESKLKAPLLVVKQENTYQALLMLCTHKACTLEANGAVLVCPCHGSEFSSSGKVLVGPASKDLFEYPCKAEKDTLNIKIA
ncbi:MAG: cytochrome b6-f complex iron-sulfur subunit [Sphingobacteriales bacterium]|jgi:cytochrome b6-f complex iron-sulfur subunit